MKKIYLFFSFLVMLSAACSNFKSKDQVAQKEDTVLTLAKTYFQPLPAEAVNFENPLTPEKVALGKTLYYDNRLSMNNTQSCNTCHNLATFGVDNKPTSPGDLGKNGTRNSPTTLNAALHSAQFWDGRMKDVEEQAGGPMMNPIEMNMPSEKEVIARLSRFLGYRNLFAAAYPDDEDPINMENIRKSIAAFERTLITPSRFDSYLTGESAALHDKEIKGLSVYMEAGCTVCHAGALAGGTMFQKFPLIGDDYKYLTGSFTDDKGKMDVTGLESDKYVFKVPSLRNVAETGPYFHDGSVKKLDDAIDIMAKLQLSKNLKVEQITDIAVFLKSLTGEVPAYAKLIPAMP